MPTAPSHRSRQLTLRFDDTPVWDPAGLEAALQRAASRPVRLTLTENRSVLLSFRRRGGATWLRLHRMFLHAPPPVCAPWPAACAAPPAGARTGTCAAS